MKLLDRYILRGFFINYAIALLVMIGLYVGVDLIVNLDEFTEAGQDAGSTILRIADFYAFNMFLYFAQLAGIITLVAACTTVARLHRANELTAVLASGTSLYRVALPIVIAGLFMNGLGILDQEWIIPRVAHKLARPHDDTAGRTYYLWFLRDRDGAMLSARRFLPWSKEIRGLGVIHQDEKGMTRVTKADVARWDDQRRAWVLERGAEERLPHSGAPAVDREKGVVRRSIDVYESDLTPTEIVLQQAAQWTSFLSLRDIVRLQDRYAGDVSFIKMKHVRLTTPIMNMVALLLGLPFFLTRERNPIVGMAGRCLLLSGACYVVTFLGQNADFSVLGAGPALPVWLAVFLFLPLAVYRLTESIKT